MPGTAMPKQLGPTSLMPCLRQKASRSAPCAPRPEVITTSDRTPRWPHCSATAGDGGGGHRYHRYIHVLGQIGR